MKSVLSNIADKRKEIDQEINELNRLINELLDELSLIDKAEAVLRGQSLTEFKNSSRSKPVIQNPNRHNLTIKQMIVKILDNRGGEGASAIEVLKSINFLFNENIPRTSMSPQMSRLLSAGVIRKEGKIYFLTEERSEPV